MNPIITKSSRSENIYLEFSAANSHKFYQVAIADKTVTICYGRIGTEGRTEVKSFDSQEAAEKFAETKVAEKFKKGYQPAEYGARKKQPIVSQNLDERQQFWRLIELAKKESKGETEIQIDNLKTRLTKLSPKEIANFDKVLRAYLDESYRADLWGAAFLIDGGCSDDSFDYFRAWLILQGEAIFKKALENPDSLAKPAGRAWEMGREFEAERLLYIADEVYAQKTGKEGCDREIKNAPLTLQGDLMDWGDEEGDADEDKVKNLYPKLYQKFWNNDF